MIVAKGQKKNVFIIMIRLFLYFLQQHKVRRTRSDSCCHGDKYSVYK